MTQQRKPEVLANDDGAAQTSSLLSELRGGGSLEAPEASKPTNRFPTQIVVIVAVIAVAGALLFTMRQVGRRGGVDVQTKAIDYQRQSTRTPAEEARIIAGLSVTGAPKQVPAEDIQKNPFRLDTDPVPVDPGEALLTDDSASENRRLADEQRKLLEARERRRQEIDNALASVDIHGIMGGSTPLARVNGKIVRVGDTINDLLTVTQIEGRSIRVEVDGKVHTITMSDGLKR